MIIRLFNPSRSAGLPPHRRSVSIQQPPAGPLTGTVPHATGSLSLRLIRGVSTRLFLTDFGSILQTVMLGFTGIRVDEGDWAKYPASLPQGWTKIEVDRFWMPSQPVRLLATDANKANLLP